MWSQLYNPKILNSGSLNFCELLTLAPKEVPGNLKIKIQIQPEGVGSMIALGWSMDSRDLFLFLQLRAPTAAVAT